MSLRRRRDIWDVVVVGGGIGGLTAAWYAARRGLPTALIEGDVMLGGQVATVNTLDDWPSTKDESGVELAAAMAAKLENNAVEIVHQPVVDVKRADDLLLVKTDTRIFRTRRVIAASGAKLRSLDVPGADALRGKGVSQCAHCDGYFFKGQDVVVVGGGDSALQEALVLAPLCKSVTIVVRSRLRAKQAYVERAAAAANVKFVWDAQVEEVLGNGTVNGVRLRNRGSGALTEIACAGVFPFIGVEPDTAYLPAAIRRDDSGRVITDQRMRTAERSIFAVGAVRSGYSGELSGAAGEAAIAAATIAADLAR
ncbi:MAG: thioredoxin-disulfide reductase [Betaproteobacteria bacterium]|nr:thioredoxin-disulfide reductase [Betaproteobacteria bacterium]